MINLNKIYELVEQVKIEKCLDYVWLEMNSMCEKRYYHHVGNALRNVDYDRVPEVVILTMLAACCGFRRKVDDWSYAHAKFKKRYPK